MTQPNPGQPLPAYVYRRRRLAVFGGLIVFIVVVVLLIMRPGSANDSPSSSSTSLPAPTGSVSPTAPADDTPSAPTCTPGSVNVVANTDKQEYLAGENPQLTVSVENTSGQTCSLNVGTAVQVFTITSGSEVYWLSTDCQTEKSDSYIDLPPGEVIGSSVPIVWDRTRSNPGTCDIAREPVPAGDATYDLKVSVDGISSAQPTSFRLL